jgi:hypothetical protein
MARVLGFLGALALLGGAGFAFLVAGLVNWLACENEATPACSRQDLASAQFLPRGTNTDRGWLIETL